MPISNLPLFRGPLAPSSGAKGRAAPAFSGWSGLNARDHCLRIALLGYRSNPYCGGQGIYLCYLSQALTSLGHKVDVISGEPYPDLAPEVNLIPLPGMNLYSYTKPTQGLKDRGLRSATDALEYASFVSGGFPEPYAFCRRLAAYFRAHAPNYDIIHDNQSLGTGLLSLVRSGQPVISTIHHPITRDLQLALANEPNWGMRLLIRRWHRFLTMQKRVAPRLSRIITVSEQSRKDLVQDFGLATEDIDVVLNGVDTELFAPCPEITPKPHRIMATASADVPLKGLIHLLQAAAKLTSRFPDLELVVLGRPKENGPAARLIAQSGLRRHVRFVHGISTEELVLEYAGSSLAVVPSLYEGFGLPAAEAMACGVPVVATNVGGLPEVVGSAGCIVPPADPQALAAAIASLLDSPQSLKTLGRAGRERMCSRFTWKRAAEETVHVYRKVIGGLGN